MKIERKWYLQSYCQGKWISSVLLSNIIYEIIRVGQKDQFLVIYKSIDFIQRSLSFCSPFRKWFGFKRASDQAFFVLFVLRVLFLRVGGVFWIPFTLSWHKSHFYWKWAAFLLSWEWVFKQRSWTNDPSH